MGGPGLAGNAVDWRPPGGRRFDYVHILLDCVPRSRRADLIRHHLTRTVAPGTGRLLVSDYAADPAAGHPAAPGHSDPRLPLRRPTPAATPAGPAAPPHRVANRPAPGGSVTILRLLASRS